MIQPALAIEARAAGKAYRLYDPPRDQLIELITATRRHRELWALRAVDLRVRVGETLGIIGRNGSGKSTLLQLLARTLAPSTGTVVVRGRIGALLELGGALHRDFTGRENVQVVGATLGLSRAEMLERMPTIEAFAEIGPFFDRPVKTYSTGMYLRVAFAAISYVDADVLVIDEALAVGDIGFQHRCMRRFHEAQANGKTIVLVSHSTELIKTLCTRAVLLRAGNLAADGDPAAVVNEYLAELQVAATPRSGTSPLATENHRVQNDATSRRIVRGIDRSDGRFGNGDAEVIGVDVFDARGARTRTIVHGATMVVVVSVRFRRYVANPIVGLTLRDGRGVDVSRTNSVLEDLTLPAGQPGHVMTCRFRLQLPYLAPGGYSISPAIADGAMAAYQMCDWIENAVVLQLQTDREVHGYLRLPCELDAFTTASAAVELASGEDSGARASIGTTAG